MSHPEAESSGLATVFDDELSHGSYVVNSVRVLDWSIEVFGSLVIGRSRGHAHTKEGEFQLAHDLLVLVIELFDWVDASVRFDIEIPPPATSV
jgi:hypothetical protein